MEMWSVTRRVCLAALATSSLTEGSSMYFAGLCAGHKCESPEHPIIDYEDGNCVCRAHPCWSDNGLTHSCSDKPDFPYLMFSYDQQKELKCQCSSIPHYSSVFIAKDLCAGHSCTNADHPILDFNQEDQSCLCRANPCWDDNGLKHQCTKPGFPILRYRKDDRGKTVCECVQSMESPNKDSQASFDHYPREPVYDHGSDDDDVWEEDTAEEAGEVSSPSDLEAEEL